MPLIQVPQNLLNVLPDGFNFNRISKEDLNFAMRLAYLAALQAAQDEELAEAKKEPTPNGGERKCSNGNDGK